MSVLYDNNINFDEASLEWEKNKKKLHNGQFEYVCNYIHSNGKKCRKSLISSKRNNEYVYGFGGCQFNNKYINHPNKNYYCVKHINRYNPNI